MSDASSGTRPDPAPASAAAPEAFTPDRIASAMALCSRHSGWAALAVAAVVIPALHLAGMIDIVSVNQLGRFLCFAIVALGIDLVWGYAGILSLCQAMFFCLGGYAIGMHLALHGPLDGAGIPRCLFVVTSEVAGFQLPWFWHPFASFPLALALGVLVPGAVALVFGWVAFRSRVRGVYFSIITQAATLGACLIFRRNEMRLCGTNGLTNFDTLLGFDLRLPHVKLGLYLATVAALALTWLACRHLVASRLGRVLIAVRDNESRLRFAGYQPAAYKTFVFTVGAMIAGLGGMLYTPQNGIITPFKMEPAESIFMVVWVAVGGRGTLSGAIVGALLVNAASSMLTSRLPTSWPFVLGSLAIGVVLFFPDGVVGSLRSRMLRRAHGEPPSPPSPPTLAPPGTAPTIGSPGALAGSP